MIHCENQKNNNLNQTYLPRAFTIEETQSVPKSPPMANMETVDDHRRVTVSLLAG